MNRSIPADKESLVNELEQIFAEFKELFVVHGEAFFMHTPKDKWSAGQHLIHLTKVNKGAAQGLSVSKIILRISNGLQRHPVRTYPQLKTEYINALKKLPVGAGAAKPGAAPTDLKLALEKYDKYSSKLIAKLKSYDENDLNKYRIPHPLYGKMALIEFLYFVHFHVIHHLDALNEKYLFKQNSH